jgi:bifunctional non-homologous end joining protein LigD
MVLDGEIVTVDAEGRSCFYELLHHRGQPVFYAFDCLSLDGRDLRGEPLTKRKRILKAAVKDVVMGTRPNLFDTRGGRL